MQHLSEIVEEARKKGKKRLAVAYGQDAHTLQPSMQLIRKVW